MTTSTTPTGITRSDRITLLVFAGIAAAIGLATLVGGALRIRLYATAASDGSTPVSLLTGTSVPGVPTEGDPSIRFGVFPTADLLVTGLSDGTRALLAVGEGIGVLVTVVVSAAIFWLFLSLARARPFAPSLHRLTLVAGATFALGSMLGQGIAGFGRMNAAAEVNPVADNLFSVGFTLDLAPIVIGFAIMALAFVFRAGTRLQRETEGLI